MVRIILLKHYGTLKHEVHVIELPKKKKNVHLVGIGTNFHTHRNFVIKCALLGSILHWLTY